MTKDQVLSKELCLEFAIWLQDNADNMTLEKCLEKILKLRGEDVDKHRDKFLVKTNIIRSYYRIWNSTANSVT